MTRPEQQSGGHTPGPWVVVTGKNISVGPCPGQRVAVCNYDNGPVEKANARLIAAAPDSHAANVAMVDALNVAFGITSDHDDDYIYDTLPTSAVAAAYFAARAAIAKAVSP